MASLLPLVLRPLNHVLEQETWTAERLQPHTGKVAAFRLANLEFRFAISREGRLEGAERGKPADVEIELPAEALAKFAQGRDGLFATARLSGKADFAEAIGFVLRHARWDVEEDLSRIFGDIAAHRLVAAGRTLASWSAEAAGNIVDSIGEFMRYDTRALASSEEVESFRCGIDDLRQAVDRIEYRLQSIERKLAVR